MGKKTKGAAAAVAAPEDGAREPVPVAVPEPVPVPVAVPVPEPVLEPVPVPVPVPLFEAKWKQVASTCGYCGLCKGIFRSFSSHSSRRPNCKKHAESRKLNESELAELKGEVELEFTDPVRHTTMIRVFSYGSYAWDSF